MKTLTTACLVVGLALTAGASALAADETAGPAANPPAKRACFFSHQINGWREDRSARDTVVYLDVNAHDVYRLDMFGPCNGINEAFTIGVETRGGGTAICDGLDVTLITNSPIGPFRCPVSKITRLTPEEIKALSASKRR
ncbi:MAG: DUF6491 family protein [Caulobacter sp.]|nr:DUF6491 family protein [Caulobacter sp.]